MGALQATFLFLILLKACECQITDMMPRMENGRLLLQHTPKKLMGQSLQKGLVVMETSTRLAMGSTVLKKKLHQIHDQRRKWREIVDAFYIFVYREGTLDQATFNLYHFDENSSNNNSGSGCTTSIVIRNKGNNTPATCIVSLNDTV